MIYDIVLVGCGATGSNIATFISQLAVSDKSINKIILVDGDLVEGKNFINQKYTSKDINKNKARVLATRFSKLGIKISYIDKYIESSIDLNNILSKLKNNIILIGAVDNIKARIYMDNAFYSEELKTIIYIDTGNGDIDRCGQTIVGSKVDGKFITRPVSAYYPLIETKEYTKEDNNYRCSQIQEHPQNLATNILSATTTFILLSNIISGRRVGKKYVTFNVDKVEII